MGIIYAEFMVIFISLEYLYSYIGIHNTYTIWKWEKPLPFNDTKFDAFFKNYVLHANFASVAKVVYQHT